MCAQLTYGSNYHATKLVTHYHNGPLSFINKVRVNGPKNETHV